MSTAAANLTLVQGRDASFVLDVARVNLPFDEADLVGFVFCVKQHVGQTDAEAPIRKTLAAGVTILPESDANLVRLRLDLTRAETAGLSPLILYFWDTAILTADDKLFPIDTLAGRLEVVARVSHSTA